MPKVLIVDDDPDNIELMARFLKKRGFEIVEAGNGPQAIELARAEQPDLVLMDMVMPEMDGTEATRQLKSDPRTAAIPVLALTGDVVPEQKRLALEAGCVDIVPKANYDQNYVHQRIVELLGGGPSP